MVRFASYFVLSTSFFVLFSGCTTSDYPTAKTTGRVICEGQPVPHVIVFFEPMQTGKSALVGKQGVAHAETDGTFSISTYGENDGAVIGHHRVRVGLPRGDDLRDFKCACYINPEVDVMEVDVKKGKNEFEIVLKKKTGREAPLLKD